MSDNSASASPALAAEPAHHSAQATNPPVQATEPRPRLWPGVAIVAVQWLIVKGAGWLAPGTMVQFATRFWGPLLGALLFACWWMFGSRIRRRDRLLVLLLCGVFGAGAVLLRHPSFAGIALFGFFLYALSALTVVWIAWLVVTPFLRWPVRQTGLCIALFLVWGYFTLLRFEGTDGELAAEMPFRWTPTSEEKRREYRAQAATKAPPKIDRPQTLVLAAGDWPGFRGAKRDGCLTGVRISKEWNTHPPRQLWRHPIGPGWSSFAVVGTRIYTQEQHDADEVVTCYDASTGAELWVHRDAVRFTEAVAGPGPRATPTFHEGKIYALGAAGKLNCLDAITGKKIWYQDIVADSGAKIPTWGFAASPLISDGVVLVFAGGPQKKSVLGYKADTGELQWSAGEGQFSYASLHPARIGGVKQAILASEEGLVAFAPAGGDILWRHNWPLTGGMARVVQPALVDDSSVLIGTGFGMGSQRVRVDNEGGKWAVKQEWTSQAIKPYYNDLVVHKGYLYGFDNNFFTCVKLDDGKKAWRARGYGNGQVLLLADQDLLLIQAETGEAALVLASPDGHKELGRFQALEGKTWNHPVVAHGKLFVRNGAEAACYHIGTGEE